MGAVQFILGRAGTGKTTLLVDHIADQCRRDPLGPPIYWLLPKQATFDAERLLTAKLGGFARVHVVDFHRLGQAVLTSCGDIGMPEVTPAGRRMVIGLLLRRNRDRLTYYKASAHRSGLTAELDATFGEFERAGLDPEGLALVVDTLDPADDPAATALRQKLTDVRLLLGQYVDYVGQDRLDPARRLKLVRDRIGQCPALADATLFVDDFYDFSTWERQLLSAVAARVERTELAMLLDPDDPATSDPHLAPSDLSTFHRPLRAYRGLLNAMKGLTVEPAVTLRAVHTRPPGLVNLERGLFDLRSPAPTCGASTVDLFDTPDVRAEVDAVARQIRALVVNGAVRYRDVAVLVRSLGDYREVVHASFAEHGIPYFADHRRSATHHPVLQVVRACLIVAAQGWPHDVAMTLAKSGLVGLTDDEADQLENYALQHRVRGRPAWEAEQPWPFAAATARRDDDGPRESTPPAVADGLRRRIADPLAPLLAISRAGGSVPVRAIATALFQVLGAFGVDKTLARWMADADAANDVERRGEHEQVWAELTGLFDQIVDVIGDEPMTVAGFLDVLDGGLEGFDLAIPPAKVDQVLLAAVDRTRTPAVKVTFVLGLAEGRFPRVAQDPLVLTDAERRTLRGRQVELDEETERQLLDERFLAYVAVTRAAQQLVVSRPLADEKGRALNPSLFWMELQRLCPDVPVRHVPRSSALDPRTIGTPRQLVDALMRWVGDGSPPGDVLPALYHWLATHEPDGTAVDTMRFRAWKALSYRNEAKLDPTWAAKLFPPPLRATVRQLEDANACPFRHFARYGLELRVRESHELTGIDLHNAYHQVVENLTRELLDRNTDWTHLKPSETRELIRAHAAQVGRQLRGELMLSTARNRYLLDHIERTLERAVTSLAEQGRRGKYRPWRANLRFGGSGAELGVHAVTTPAGRSVELHGRIDRVDLNDRRSAFTVSDYKLAPSTLTLDRVYHGLSLQLLTYLLVVQQAGPTLNDGKKITPAAAFLLGLLSSPRPVLHPSDGLSPDDPDFPLRTKPRGLIDERAVDSLDGGGETGASKVVAAYRKKEGGFGHRHATDVATADEFAALVALVDRRLGEAADRVLDGDVAVRPYMLGRATPCPRCEYRTVCRFEPGLNAYRVLPPMGRTDVLLKVIEASQEAPA
jgi:ATP-dependent helicase/nuclease subunit B